VKHHGIVVLAVERQMKQQTEGSGRVQALSAPFPISAPGLGNADRQFWICATRWFADWRNCLLIVKSETVATASPELEHRADPVGRSQTGLKLSLLKIPTTHSRPQR
jgi:hypothetical protein